MKFYQTIVPVMLCIMHSATIFGTEKAILPYLGSDIYGLIEEFGDLYKETAHIKRYPSLLREVLAYYPIYGDYGGPSDGTFEIVEPRLSKLMVMLGLGLGAFHSIIAEKWLRGPHFSFAKIGQRTLKGSARKLFLFNAIFNIVMVKM